MTQPIFCQTPTHWLAEFDGDCQIHFRKAHLNMKEQIVCVIIWSNGERLRFLGTRRNGDHPLKEKIQKKQQ